MRDTHRWVTWVCVCMCLKDTHRCGTQGVRVCVLDTQTWDPGSVQCVCACVHCVRDTHRYGTRGDAPVTVLRPRHNLDPINFSSLGADDATRETLGLNSQGLRRGAGSLSLLGTPSPVSLRGRELGEQQPLPSLGGGCWLPKALGTTAELSTGSPGGQWSGALSVLLIPRPRYGVTATPRANPLTSARSQDDAHPAFIRTASCSCCVTEWCPGEPACRRGSRRSDCVTPNLPDPETCGEEAAGGGQLSHKPRRVRPSATPEPRVWGPSPLTHSRHPCLHLGVSLPF